MKICQARRCTKDIARRAPKALYCSLACKQSEFKLKRADLDPNYWKNEYDPMRRRKMHIQAEYGIKPEDFQSMYDAQHGLCAICELREATCIDHNHATGQVRGLLCRKCNTAIGLIGEDEILLRKAAEYIKAWTLTIG